jgi:WD40 repeat protein
MAASTPWGQRAELSPDGKLLAVSDSNGLVLHDTGSGVVVRTLPGNGPIAWSGDGSLLVSGRARGLVRLGDPGGGAEKLVDASTYRVRAVALPAADRLVTLASERDLLLWDLQADRPLWAWAGGAHIDSLLVPPAGARWFAVAQRRLLAIDPTSGDPLGAHDTQNSITAAAIRDDGQLIAVATRHGPGAPAPLRLLGPTFADQGTIEVTDEMRVLRFAPDGRHLAGGGGKQLVIWTLPGSQAVPLVGHGGTVDALAFRGDGALLASAAQDRTIRLWRTDGTPAATIVGALDGPLLVLAPDGRCDGTAGDDGAAALLSWQVGDVILPGFVGWQRRHTPGLLAELLGGKPAATAPRPAR